jgi:hypothetical protein
MLYCILFRASALNPNKLVQTAKQAADYAAAICAKLYDKGPAFPGIA